MERKEDFYSQLEKVLSEISRDVVGWEELSSTAHYRKAPKAHH
jgi:hypothetical protein